MASGDTALGPVPNSSKLCSNNNVNNQHLLPSNIIRNNAIHGVLNSSSNASNGFLAVNNRRLSACSNNSSSSSAACSSSNSSSSICSSNRSSICSSTGGGGLYPHQSAVVVSPPIPEFRDANNYWADQARHIIRPKPRRPGDHRLSGSDAVAAMSKPQQALQQQQQHMEQKQDAQQRLDKEEKHQEQQQKQHKQQLQSLKEQQKQQQLNKSDTSLKHPPVIQNNHVANSLNSPSTSNNNNTSSNNKICSISSNPVKPNNASPSSSSSSSSSSSNNVLLSSTSKNNLSNLSKNIGHSPGREQLASQQQQQQQQHPQQSSEQLLPQPKPPSKQQQQTQQQQISQQQQQQHKVLRGDTPVDKNSPSNVGKGAHTPRDSSQTRNHSRESRGLSRERLGNAYPRHDYFQQKIQEYPSKSQDYLNKLQDYPNDHKEYSSSKKPADYPIVCQDNNQSKSQEYLNKLEYSTSPSKSPQEYHGKVHDYPIKTQAYKSPQSRGTSELPGINSSRQHSPQAMSGVPQVSANALRERVGSPHRVTSPPVKLHEGPRLQSPPVKMIDSRHEYSKLEAMNNSGTCAKLDSGVPTTPLGLNSSHFLQPYPERDNSKSQAPVWEAGYLLEKYSGGPYSPLPPVYPAAKLEKAIDDQDYQDTRPSNGIPSSKENDVKYQAEKEDADSACAAPAGPNVSGNGGNATDLQKVAASKGPAKIVPLTVLPSESLEVVYHQGGITQHEHVGQQQCQGHHSSSFSPETTDCGSLSKSSSDGDHSLMNRKRPPTKLKSKRRNILSFPHHLSMDELRLIQRREESYGGGGGSSSDDNRSSGHASMSDGHTSSSPPVDTLPRPHDHHVKPQLKVRDVYQDIVRCRYILLSQGHMTDNKSSSWV